MGSGSARCVEPAPSIGEAWFDTLSAHTSKMILSDANRKIILNMRKYEKNLGGDLGNKPLNSRQDLNSSQYLNKFTD